MAEVEGTVSGLRPQGQETPFASLRTGAFPFARLTDYDVRVALLAAHGLLDDHGLVGQFAQSAEEEITEARGQAMEP